MSQALLKKFRRAGQGSREQKEIVRRAENQLRRNEMLGQKPNKSLQTIMGEYVKESGDQLSAKRKAAIAGASWMVGGPLLKGVVKGVQLGRAAMAGLPKGITKVRGGFKFGDKTYKTLGGAKGAATRAGKKPPPAPKTPAAPKAPADKVAAATRGRTTAAQRPNKTQRQLQRNEREAAKLQKAAGSGGKQPGKLKAAIVPAAATAIGARELLKDSKPGPKPAAAKKPAPKLASKPRSTIADVKKKPTPPVKKQAPPKAKVSSGGRSKGRGGIDSGLLEFMKFAGGRDAFKPDAIDRGLASLGGGEVSDPMVKAEATYLNSLYDKEELGLDLTKQEQSFMDNFGKKRGGRLKKKKPVARKKAVTKKAPVRKKAVAKKPVARRRGAKRGFGVALRGY